MPNWVKKILVLLVICFLLILILKIVIIKNVYNYAVQNIINISGMSTWLAKGIVILVLIPFIWAILEITKLRNYVPFLHKRSIDYKRIGIFIIIFYIGIFFLSMYYLSRESNFSHIIKKPLKFYAITPEGIRFFDSPGYDPKYGIKLKPVTPEIINQYERAKRGMYPKQIEISTHTELFNPITGEPKVWYYKDSEGNYEFFDNNGFHPKYRVELKPITKDVILDHEKRVKEKKERIRKEVYIKKYINPIISNDSSKIDFAILILEKEGLILSDNAINTSQIIEKLITDTNQRTTIGLFKKPFITEGLFKKIYSGSTKDVSLLTLKSHVDYLIFGIKQSSFFEDSRLNGLKSCNLILEIKIISAFTGEIIAFNSFKQIGIGINTDKAESQALDKLSNDIEEFILNNIKH